MAACAYSSTYRVNQWISSAAQSFDACMHCIVAAGGTSYVEASVDKSTRQFEQLKAKCTYLQCRVDVGAEGNTSTANRGSVLHRQDSRKWIEWCVAHNKDVF